YRPEYRYYAYDFFFDNCSSRIRDIFEKLFSEEVISSQSNQVSEVSFRQLLDYYLTDKPWSDFGIDLILGQPSDEPADFRQQMFLPDYLKDNLENSKTTNRSIVLEKPKVIYAFPRSGEKIPLYSKPIFWTLLLFGMALLMTFNGKNQKWVRYVDVFLFVLSGLAGALFLFMWLGTEHQACYANWNMLWLFPGNIIMAWALRKPALSKEVKTYFGAIAGLIFICITCGWFLPQQFHIAFYPLMATFFLRAIWRILEPMSKA
ncbi:MAG: hypothetical protein HKN16_04730, partial [Saprospiraceae bacterium]|nr:hypothetical protein [Saprospiraceae bacterium]